MSPHSKQFIVIIKISLNALAILNELQLSPLKFVIPVPHLSLTHLKITIEISVWSCHNNNINLIILKKHLIKRLNFLQRQVLNHLDESDCIKFLGFDVL